MARLPLSRRAAPGLYATLAWALLAASAAAQTPPAPTSAPEAERSPPTLTRVVLLPRIEDVVPAGAPAEGAAVDAASVPVLADPAAQAVIRPFLGKTLDSAVIAGLRAAVGDHYARIGRPFVRVTLPRQDVTNGVLQLVVLEARVGKVTVEGQRWFDADQYRGQVRLRPGDPIDESRLQADLDWINRNPYRHATAVAQPGQAAGTTDLVIRAQERRPLSLNAGYDNTGNHSTGLERASLGFDWENAFGRGDGLNYQFTLSPDSGAVRQHSLGYSANLPWRHILNLSASYATSHSPSGEDFDSTGVSKIASLRYSIPLRPRGRLTHQLGLGFDFKSSNNDILFGGVSVFPTTSEVDQFVVDYGGQASDRLGATSFSLTFVGSPGGLSSNNTDAAFDAQQFGAKATYAYARASASRTTTLPDGFSWSARLTGQVSQGVLLPSEQLMFGGVQSVRGFLEQGALRDQGLLWQNELRPPPLSGGLAKTLSLSPFWFLDAGFGQNRHTSEPDKTWLALASTGPGATWQISRHAAFRFTWGIPLVRTGAVGRLLGPQFGIRATF